ncbi:MAG: efflux RND transporter periplasmic adaptor subunit, partial [Verrucomicrobia bacterium]|nr:efflux RND transporter periplasmic adaptor subunit [Verrucomicrobiota bacterium]
NESVEIKSETEGIVQEVLFNEGERVEKGHLLLRLDESKWSAAVSEAEANFKLSQANFDRAQQLLKDKLISQQEFDQAAAIFEVNRSSLELKKRNLKDARVIAPFTGMTGSRSVSPGQVISRNSTLTWLIDLDQVKVELNVPERFLSQVKIGQSIEFDVAAYAGQKFKGEVYFIAPQVDLVYRTALVKALIKNREHLLKPGMFANLELTLKVRDEAVVIPEVAILNNGDTTYVYLVNSDQAAQMQVIKVGQRLSRWAEITDGLRGGEQVIVEGHQKIAPGIKVKPAGPEASAVYLN